MNWNGKYGKGAMKQRREIKRKEAEQRNEQTPEHRRAAYRRSDVEASKHR